MPIHDWSRVSAGTFHHFHGYWVGEIGKALNNGVLPSNYYALTEQLSGQVWPDVLTLKHDRPSAEPERGAQMGLLAPQAPPKTRFVQVAEQAYVRKQKTLVIRYSGDDEIVALIEVLSPGNKASRRELRAFLDKAVSALVQGIHLLVLDLHPPTKRDPEGIHGAIWSELVEEPDFCLPANKPLTLAAYAAGAEKRAYVEPVAIGDALPDMPVFLTPDEYVSAPLEAAYEAAYQAVPLRWRQVLDA